MDTFIQRILQYNMSAWVRILQLALWIWEVKQIVWRYSLNSGSALALRLKEEEMFYLALHNYYYELNMISRSRGRQYI